MKLLQINLFRFSLISILLCALQYEALAQTVLLVTDINGTLNTEESARKSAFEGWGYTVTTIHDNADQSTYDSAITSADIVYVPGTIDDYQLLYKLRTAPIGVITETQGLDTEFGYASSDGYTENQTQINITDNSHPVSAGVSSGNLTIFSSSQPRALNGNSLAAGMTTLGMNGAANMLTLGVIDAGGTLANTYNSNSTASGRRVRMPWSNITWSALNSSGLSIVQNALSWAAGGSSNELVAHWKLDETSGTTASDSSGNGHDGSFYGSATWSTEGKRYGSVDVDGAERINVPAFDLGGSELTLAAWVKPENLTNEGRLIMKSSNNTAAGQSWGIAIDDSGAVDLRVNAGGTWDRLIVSNAVSVGNWYHLLGTYDGTTMRVYVDGVLVGSASHSTGGALSEGSSDSITIGDSPLGGREVDGLVDDVRVYNYALNESEISKVYGFLGHYKLDETSGTTANDSSGVGNDGTYQGNPTLNQTGPYAGKGSKAVTLDGDADYIELPNESDYDITDAITVAVWIQVNQFDEGYQAIIAKGDSAWRLSRDNNTDTLHFACNGLSTSSLYGNINVNDGKWHHVVGVYDGNTISLYVDGKLDVSAASTGTISTNDYPAMLGRNAEHTWRDWNGGLFDARIYDRALSEAEIAELYGLIAHWKLDESSGSTAEDSSLAENDASRTGTEAWTTGQDSGGHEFDYTNGEEYFTAPTNSALNDVQEDDYTIMAYFRPDSIPPGSGSDNDSSYAILLKTGWHEGLTFSADGEFKMDHWLDGNTWSGAGTWGISYSPGQFYHVAGVVNRTDGTVKIYVNGELIDTGNFTPGTGARDYGNSAWRIGVGDPGGVSWGYPCDGVIDDVRIYNRALSDDEISAFAVAGSGLIAHWTFDEGSGTTIADSSGSGNDATFNTGAPSWTTGVYDGAIEFNGSNDIDTNSNFDPPATGSIAFWFKPSGLLSSTERLFGTSGSWEVRMSSSGQLFFDISAEGGPDASINFTSSSSWYHAVFNYDSDADTYEIYINGELNESGSYSISDQSAALLSFGTRTGSSDRFYGALDDIRVYNKQLTPIEVSELYGLIGYWAFDEGSGSTVSDSSALGQHASFSNGSPTWTEGVYGMALEFDGVDDEVATDNNFDPPETGAISFWMKSAGTPTGRHRPFGLGDAFEAYQDTDGILHFDLNYTGAPDTFANPERLDSAGIWYHVIAQFNSNTDDVQVYVNGELKYSETYPQNLTKQAENILSFGTRTGSTQRFTGTLDEFRIYNRWLTIAEVNDLYGRLAYWKLDETSGSTAVDASSHGNDGDYTGGPTLGVNGAFSANTATAVSLDGSSEYIDTNNSIVNDLSAFTMMGWVRADDVEATQSFFGQNDAIELGLNFSSGQLHLWTENGGSLDAYNQLPVGKWTHVAVTGDGSDLKIYVNGRETISGGNTTANYGNSSDAFMLGAGVYSGSGDYLDGRLDDVQVFDRALKPEQIYNLYKGGRPAGIRILNWLETR